MPHHDEFDPFELMGQSPWNRKKIVQHENAPPNLVSIHDIKGALARPDEPELSKEALLILDGIMSIQDFKQPGKYVESPTPVFPLLTKVLDSVENFEPENKWADWLLDNPTQPARTAYMGGHRMIGAAIRSIVGLLGIKGPQEVFEAASPTGQGPKGPQNAFNTTSAANPRIEISPEAWNELGTTGQRARLVNRLAYASTIGSLVVPAATRIPIVGNTVGELPFTVDGAILQGELAPPINAAESAMDLLGENLLGPLLPSAAMFPVMAAGMSVRGASAVGGAVAKGLAPKAAKFSGTKLGQYFGLNQASERAMLMTLMQQREFLGRTAASELALGLGYGGAWGGAHAMETGGDAMDITLGTLGHGLAGGLLGGMLAIPFRFGTLKTASALARGLDNAVGTHGMAPKAGEVFDVGGDLYKMTKNGRWMKRNPEMKGQSQYGWKFIKQADAPEDEIIIQSMFKKAYGQFSDDELLNWSLMGKTAETQAMKSKAASGSSSADPAEATSPDNFKESLKFDHEVTMTELDYYGHTAVPSYRKDPPEVFEAKLKLFRSLARSEENQLLQAEYLGRARAMERARANDTRAGAPTHDAPERLPGIEDFETERLVRDLLTNDEAQLDNIIFHAQSAIENPHIDQSQKVVYRSMMNAAKRQRSLSRARTMSGDASKGFHNAQAYASRGAGGGTEVILPDGTIGRLRAAPNSGVAEVVNSAGEIRRVSVDDLTLIPKKGRYIRTDDGTVLKVKSVATKKQIVTAVDPEGNTIKIPLDEIDEVGNMSFFNRKLGTAFKKGKSAVNEGTPNKNPKKQSQPRKVVNDKTGQTETVVAEDVEEVVTKTSKGGTRTRKKTKGSRTARKGSKAATQTAGRTTTTPEIYVFEPGTKPVKGRNINYVGIPADQVDVVASHYLSTGDAYEFIGNSSTGLRIFPPSADDGATVVFAIDKVGASPRSPNGKAALGILNPKSKKSLQGLSRKKTKAILNAQTEATREALLGAKVYEVPAGLRNQVRGVDDLRKLPVAEQEAYLRKLQDLSFDASERVTVAKDKQTVAKANIEKAKKTKDGGGKRRAEIEHEDARMEQVQARVEDQEEVGAVVQRMVADEIKRTGDVEDHIIDLKLREGDPTATRAAIASMHVSERGPTRISQPYVLTHPDASGIRMELRRYQDPVPRLNEIADTWELKILDASGHQIGRTRKINKYNNVRPARVAANRATIPLEEFRSRGLFNVAKEGYHGSDFPQVMFYTEDGVPVTVEKVIRTRGANYANRRQSSAVKDMPELPGTQAEIEVVERGEKAKKIFGPQKETSRRTQESAQRALDSNKEVELSYKELEAARARGEEIDPQQEEAITKAYQRMQDADKERFSVLLREQETGRILRPMDSSDQAVEPVFHLNDDGTLSQRAMKDVFEEPRSIKRTVNLEEGDPTTAATFYEQQPLKSVDILSPVDDTHLAGRTPRSVEEFSEIDKLGAASEAQIRSQIRTIVPDDNMILDEVVREIGDFQFQRKLALTGHELQGPYPDMYATIYRDPLDKTWKLQLWENPRGTRDPEASISSIEEVFDDGTVIHTASKRFATQEQAERFASEVWGFKRNNAGRVTDTKLDDLVAARIAAEKQLKDILPPGITLDDAMGEFDVATRKSAGGAPSRIIADNIDDDAVTSRTISGLKSKISVARKKVAVRIDDSGGLNPDQVTQAMTGSDYRSIVESLPRREPDINWHGSAPIWLETAPLPDAIHAADLRKYETLLVRGYNYYYGRNSGWIPPEYRSYMAKFAQHFYDRTGRAPWGRPLRTELGVFTPDDLHALGKQGKKGFVKMERTSPEGGTQVRSGYGIEDAPMELGGVTGAYDAGFDQFRMTNNQFMPGKMIGFTPPRYGSEALTHARDVLKATRNITDNAAQMVRTDMSVNPMDITENLGDAVVVRLSPQALDNPAGDDLAKVVGWNLEEGTARVMTSDGSVHSLDIDQFDRVYSTDPMMDTQRMARQAQGEPVLHDATIDQGLGHLDGFARIGELDTFVQVRGKLNEHAKYILTGKPPVGIAEPHILEQVGGRRALPKSISEWSPRDINDVMAVHRRSVELGHPEVMPNAFKKNGYSTATFKAIQRRVFEEAAAEWSHVDGVGHMVGKVKAGLTTKKDLDNIAAWAKERGIVTDNPVRQVELLAADGAVNPELTNLMLQLNKEAGFAGWWGDVFADAGHVQIKQPPKGLRDINHLQVYTASTRFMAKRHPLFDMLGTAVYDAQNREGSRVLKGRDTFRLLEDQARFAAKGTNKKPVDVLEELVELRIEHGSKTWDELLAEVPSIDKNYEVSWNQLGDFFESARERTMIYDMRAGREWVQMKDLPFEQQMLYAQHTFGLPVKDIPPETLVLNPQTRAGAIRSKTEARQMIAGVRNYDNATHFKAAHPDAPQWMVDEFDQWKSFGINDYWPHVHTGNYFIEQQLDDGTWKLIATAKSGYESDLAVRELSKRGHLKPTDTVRWHEKSPIVDDVGQLSTRMSKAQYRSMVRRIAKETEVEAITVADALSGAGIRPISNKVGFANARQRRADMRNLLSHPMDDLEIYNARLTRNEYLQDIDDAFTWAQDHEGAIAKAFGLPRMQKDLPNMQQFFNDLWATSRGDQGKVGDFSDTIAMYFEWASHLPENMWKKMANVVHPLDDPDLARSLRDFNYYRTVRGGSKLAGNIAHFQSLVKLGVTPMAAYVNMTQLVVNTAPYVGELTTFRAAGTLAKLWRGTLDDAEARLYHEVLERVGTPFQKNIATQVPGLGDIDKRWKDIVSPLVRGGKSRAKQAFDATEHAAMWAFNGVEKVNRGTTAIAAYNKGIKDGLAHEGAIKFAQDVVEETQFMYFDQAMPKMFRGPIAKVLTQFKTYMYGQMRFEKDFAISAWKGAQRGDFDMLSRYARHNLYMGAAGGLSFFANHPMLAPLAAIGSAMGWGPNWIQKKIGGPFDTEKIAAENYLERKQGGSHLMKDVALYGIHGMAGIDLSKRVGATAADFDLRDASSFFGGPMGSAYHQFFKTIKHEGEVRGPEGVLPGLVGTAIASKMIRGFRPGTFAGPAGAAIAGWVAGQYAYQKLFTEQPSLISGSNIELQKLFDTLLPTIIQDGERAVNLMGLIGPPAQYNDNYGRPVPVPGGQSLLHETLTTLIGGNSTAKANAQAYESMMTSRDQNRRARRQLYSAQAAQAKASGDLRLMYNTLAASSRDNIFLLDEDIDRVAEKLLRPRLTTVLDGMLNTTSSLGE